MRKYKVEKSVLIRPLAILLWSFLLLLGCGDEGTSVASLPFQGEIKVGILHSRSGTMALSEGTAAEGEALAIEEINRRGGIQLGGKRLKIIAIEEDGASDPRVFAEKARKLIDVDHVSVVFGGWTSASRKAMLPVFEERNSLLFYPIQYEGQECSPNIFYGGATPNQQIEPALNWLIRHRGTSFFLVGSDYIFPRTAHRIIRGYAQKNGAEVLGESFLPMGSNAVAPVIAGIQKALPHGGVIINTLNGDSNVAFFKALNQGYLTPANGYYTMSFSIAEEEVTEIGAENLVGSFASWSFFETLETAASRQFTKAFKFRFGQKRVTSDPTETGYTMVNLWALGVQSAKSSATDEVKKALLGVTFNAPEGSVQFRPNHHLKKLSLIGEVQADGMFKIISNNGLIEPKTWNQYLPDEQAEVCQKDLKSSGVQRLPCAGC
ncbi:MAG: urea transporter substrate-binding protein [Pseudomonadota bacterium]